jgi:hypothetical protein
MLDLTPESADTGTLREVYFSEKNTGREGRRRTSWGFKREVFKPSTGSET